MTYFEANPQCVDQYRKAVMKNFHYTKSRPDLLYAEIRDCEGNLLVAATADYCMERMCDVARFF